jgi:AP-3 complex subunit delta-1
MSSLRLESDESPVVVIQFSISNLSEEKMLPKLHLEFAESFDLKMIQDNIPTHIAYATEIFELQASEVAECIAHFEILGNVRPGLCIRGVLFYDVEVQKKNVGCDMKANLLNIGIIYDQPEPI